MAEERINLELQVFNHDKLPYIKGALLNTHNIYQWKVIINGPQGTPYQNGQFYLIVSFPKNYPINPPSIKFITKIFHPNVNKNGQIELSIIKDKWAPALTVLDAINQILKLMKEPNLSESIQKQAAESFIEDRLNFIKKAKQITQNFAI